MSSSRTLAWLKYRFIGDAVLATPLLHALAQNFPAPDVLVSPHLKTLLSGEPGMNLVDLLPQRGFSAIRRTVLSIRKQRYDTVVLVNRNYRSALLARVAGIKRRIGHDTEGRAWLLTDPVPYDPMAFEGLAYANLGSPLGLNVPAHPPRLTLRPGERERGDELRAGATVMFQPGATVADRTFPTVTSAEIINALSAEGHRVALIGGAAERSFVEPLLPLLNEAPVDLVGACSLRETMGVLQGGSVLVAPDSGMVHVSAAMGLPTVTTFSLSPSSKWGHDYPPHRIFSAPECAMPRMDVGAVIDAAREILGR